MRAIGAVPVWLRLLAIGWAVWVPLPAIAGTNLLAIDDLGSVPDARATGHDSFSGDRIIYSFEDRAWDFGRVIVRTRAPYSVVRRDLFVGFAQGALVVDASKSAGRGGVDVDEVEIWLRLRGKLRSGGRYEWEMAATGRDDKPVVGFPALIPFFWADGASGGANVTVTMPPQPTGDGVRRMILPRGDVRLHAFERQTGAAWVVLKPSEFKGRFAVSRCVFREIDPSGEGERAGDMPTPVSYVPIRSPVDRRVHEAVTRGAEALLDAQDGEGYWPDTDAEARIRLTAAAVAALATAGQPEDLWSSAVAWLSAQELDQPKTWRSDTVAARLSCLARFGPFKSLRRVIHTDIAALADAQARTGGWARARSADPRAGALSPGNDHRQSALVIAALEDARYAGAVVDSRLWRRAMQYWTDAQIYEGGYGRRLEPFGGLGDTPTVGGTAQGAAALMASLDMAAGFGGRHCSTYRSSRKQLEAIQQAIGWLDENFGEYQQRIGAVNASNEIYEQAESLQRFSATFGRPNLNETDHFQVSSRGLLDHLDAETGLFGVRGRDDWQETPSLWRTARAVSVLAAGRAPTLLQRIVVGDAADGFGELKADLTHLARYLAARGRREMHWRRTSIDRPVRELIEVPILVVSVVGPVEWSQLQWRTLREYCLAGGTVVIDIGDNAASQREAMAAGLRRAFPEFELRSIEPGDSVLSGTARVADLPAMSVMGNGFREFLFLGSNDWSCEWHLFDADAGSFELMNRLLAFVTDDEPVSALRAMAVHSLGAVASFSLKATHLEVGVDRPVYPSLLAAVDRVARDRFRLSVDAVHEGEDSDFLWISVTGGQLPDESTLTRIRRAIQRGAFVFVDIVSGEPAWDVAARGWLGELAGVSLDELRGTNPVYTGDIPGTRGFDVVEVGLRTALHTPFAKTGRCPLYQLSKEDGATGVYCAYDISSGIGNHRFPDCRGPVSDSARELAMNVLLRAYEHKLMRRRLIGGIKGANR